MSYQTRKILGSSNPSLVTPDQMATKIQVLPIAKGTVRVWTPEELEDARIKMIEASIKEATNQHLSDMGNTDTTAVRKAIVEFVESMAVTPEVVNLDHEIRSSSSSSEGITLRELEKRLKALENRC